MMDLSVLERKLALAVGNASKRKEKETELQTLKERLRVLEEELQRLVGYAKGSDVYSEDWRERLQAMDEQRAALLQESNTLESYEKNVKEAAERISFEEQVQVVLQKLWGIVSMSGIESLNEYLTDTVSAVFGRDIEVKAEYRFKGKVREAAVFVKDSGISEFVPIELCGGSLFVVVGIILLMLFIESRRAPKMLVLDETLSELSDTTLEGILTLLSRSGFTVIMATHDVRIKESGLAMMEVSL